MGSDNEIAFVIFRDGGYSIIGYPVPVSGLITEMSKLIGNGIESVHTGIEISYPNDTCSVGVNTFGIIRGQGIGIRVVMYVVDKRSPIISVNPAFERTEPHESQRILGYVQKRNEIPIGVVRNLFKADLLRKKIGPGKEIYDK